MKNDSGITIIALIVTVIVILIIVTITVNQGVKMVDNSKVENLITDMLSIKSKIKGYAEEIDSQTWDKSNNEEKESAKVEIFKNYCLEKVTGESESYNTFYNTDFTNTEKYTYSYYDITKDGLKKMNLNSLIEESDISYKVVYAVDSKGDYKASDIIYIKGLEYKEKKYYTLSELQEQFKEEK